MVVILLVYIDSYLFVASTSILQVGIGLTSNFAACEYSPWSRDSLIARAADFMCILFYCSTKVTPTKETIIYHQVIIYLFLIERVHIVRGGTKTRKQDKLYWFHIFGLVPYLAIVALSVIFRYEALDAQGHCSIGLQRASSFPLLIYDLLIQVSNIHHCANSGLSHWTIPFPDAWVVFVPSRSKSPSSCCCQEDVQYVALCAS